MDVPPPSPVNTGHGTAVTEEHSADDFRAAADSDSESDSGSSSSEIYIDKLQSTMAKFKELESVWQTQRNI